MNNQASTTDSRAQNSLLRARVLRDTAVALREMIRMFPELTKVVPPEEKKKSVSP